MEEILEIRSCIEILANDIKVNTADEYGICSTVNRELQGIHILLRNAQNVQIRHLAKTDQLTG